MTEQLTCGRGLAEHSVLPARMAELADALADNLQAHMPALELDDEAARQEHTVYLRLSEEHRQIAARLHAVGGEMAGASDLPMGRHDRGALSSPEVAEALHRFVKAKHELLAVLQVMAEQDRQLLGGTGGADDATGPPPGA